MKKKFVRVLILLSAVPELILEYFLFLAYVDLGCAIGFLKEQIFTPIIYVRTLKPSRSEL